MSQDWTQFSKSITIKASKEKLYHAFASRAGMESWFLRECNYKNDEGGPLPADGLVQQGTSYSWLWWGWSDQTNEKGKILQANGEDLFGFTFNANGKNDMRVRVTLSPEDDEWRVTLHQYNIPIDDESKAGYFVGCGEGWTFYLANLKSIMEGGIDLRNKKESIQKVINA